MSKLTARCATLTAGPAFIAGRRCGGRGIIVHFFNREKVNHLAKGFEIVSIDEFEEGASREGSYE